MNSISLVFRENTKKFVVEPHNTEPFWGVPARLGTTGSGLVGAVGYGLVRLARPSGPTKTFLVFH